VFDLLQEAWQLYRTHARAILLTAAVLFLPGSLIHSCALTMMAGSLGVVASELGAGSDAPAPEGRITYHSSDPPLQAVRDAESAERLVMGAMFPAFLLGMFGWAITALILYGLVLPLTHGALTIAVADRYLGGNASWREYWMLLLRRLGLLLSAVIPAALLCMFGYFLLVIPGIVLSFFFVFVSPVVLIERKGGLEALKRSFELVRADWLRTALMLITFAICSAAVHWLVGLFVGDTRFLGAFFGDLLLLLVMPVPIIGSVLLYFDIRRKTEGLDDQALKTELEALAQGPAST
jgi:hypothetical protein